MNLKEFISGYNNHPVLFVGTGMSLRYLSNSYTWDGLLKKISFDLKGNDEFYFNTKYKCRRNGEYCYEEVAKILEKEFDEVLENDRLGKFKEINDEFYRNIEKENHVSRFKLYISKMFSKLEYADTYMHELTELKKVRKNIGSIITTNYDTLIEDIFEFNPLIGNDILLSNPYGSLYKIHGCVTEPSRIIITNEDYEEFNKKYELIRAQLLSLFIHNPIIFVGYSISDENIKSILKTIFSYVELNSEQARKIRKNFLLVEFDEGSTSLEVIEHDIDIGIGNQNIIGINKIKTDNYGEIYKSLSELNLPVSAMDIRKVQNVVKEIYSGGNIQVQITEDLDSLKNSDKILAIGSPKSIKYTYIKATEFIANYFSIIEEANSQILDVLDDVSIQTNQYFPIYAFSQINENIERSEDLKTQQKDKIEIAFKQITSNCHQENTTIHEILEDTDISQSNKLKAIYYSAYHDKIELGELEMFLRTCNVKSETECKQLLCLYDFKKYGNNN